MQQALTCEWLWHGATVLCDGTVTCGLDDPFKSRNYGNIASTSMQDIMAGAAVADRRHDLLCGKACDGCGLHTPVRKGAYERLNPSAPYPRTLVVESSIRCNIRCNNAVCNVANDANIHLRRESFMPWPIFVKLIDEVGPHLERLFFYNYGEPFIHPRALDMLAHARTTNPGMAISTSTNGILLARPGLAERIVGEGLLDAIGFTIAGCDEETYQRYHKGGSFAKAMEGMKRIIAAKREQGKSRPLVHWRYLLFNWNDSDEQIERAIAMSEELGVDGFRFMLTAEPMDGRSLRRAPGTPGFDAIAGHLEFQEFYDTNPLAEAGLWAIEQNATLGRFSWTGAKVRLNLPIRGGSIGLRLARPDKMFVERPTVVVRTPWQSSEASIGTDSWEETRVAVPDPYPGEYVPVELSVTPLFSPFRHEGGGDNRELGVMLAMDDVAIAPNPFRLHQHA